MKTRATYILIIYLICGCFSAFVQAQELVLICEDSTIINSLKAEVEKYSTEKRLVPIRKFDPKPANGEPRSSNELGGLINNGLFTLVLYILAGGLLLVLLYVLIKQLRPNEVIEKRVVNLDNIEDIAELNVDEELDKALADGDLRLAVRIQYLRVLQRLSEQQVIRWKPKKTNSVYVSEMQSHQLFGIFKMITRNYDYIWYGKREVTQDLYSQWLPYFDSFFEEKNYEK